MEKIQLHSVLPQVFAQRNDLDSEIWKQDVTFEKGHLYLIEAESGSGKSTFCSYVLGYRHDYSGSDELTAQYAVKPSNHPIDAKIQKLIVGQKLAMVINLAKSSDGNGSGKDDAISTVTGLLSPVFGNLSSVVYTLKVKG